MSETESKLSRQQRRRAAFIQVFRSMPMFVAESPKKTVRIVRKVRRSMARARSKRT